MQRTPAAPSRNAWRRSTRGCRFTKRDPSRETVERIDPRVAGNVDSWLVPHRDTEALLNQVKPAVASLANAGEHGILGLLTVTRSGRLAISN
jgi:hypothetical protein